jgi:hypothetical protein
VLRIRHFGQLENVKRLELLLEMSLQGTVLGQVKDFKRTYSRETKEILTDKRKKKFRFHFTFIPISLINQNGGCTKHFSLTSEGGFSLLPLPRQNPLSGVKEKCFVHPPF